MGKQRKGGKRMTSKQLTQLLEDLFTSQSGKTLTLKDIFQTLHLNTHPLKMLAIDILDELTWDDFISKVSDNSTGSTQPDRYKRACL